MVEMTTRQELLEERLTKGAQVLFDMEQAGNCGGEYQLWFSAWSALLDEYEGLLAA